MHPDDCLLDIQIETLFRPDADDRLLATNEPGQPPVPRFFLGHTRTRNVLRYRHDLSADLVRTLDQLVAQEPIGPAPTGAPPRTFDAVRTALQTHAAVRHDWRGPAPRFPSHFRPAPFIPDRPLVRATAANAGLLRGPPLPPPPMLAADQP